MRIGFACISLSLGEEGRFKTMTVKTASKISKEDLNKKLKDISINNLKNTLNILRWCNKNNIKMYRFSSSLIPLATHDINNFEWYNDEDIIEICSLIKNYSKENDIRISMHPDQFAVVNSNKEKVFNDSIRLLNYTNTLSNLLGNKTLVIHVGGVYGDKELSKQRFIENFYKLPLDVQNKICIENDDKSYNIEDVLFLCNEIKKPIILDYHHNRCNKSKYDISHYLDDIINTWHGNTPKLHLSSGEKSITDRKHSDYINIEDYKDVLNITKCKFDIMIESKAKDLSVLRLINSN